MAGAIQKAMVVTLGLLVLAALDLSASGGPFSQSTALLTLAGAAPVVAFAVLALAPSAPA
ncbi:MAG: hypothetical protein AABY18_03085 [Candidatus Thermoplasmatota archaeon]